MQIRNVIQNNSEIFPQLLAAFIATLSAISDGMQYGWTAPILPILHSKDSPVKITKSDETWLESVYLLAGLFGLPPTIYLVDKIGRRNSILISSSTTLISWIVIAVASKVELLYFARALSGAAADMAYVATPMYISEIADQNIRGFLVGLGYLMMLIGVVVIYSVAPFSAYFVPSVIGGSLIVLQLIIFPFMPQSPYYLLKKSKREEARLSLTRLRGDRNIDQELEEIAKAIERQNEEKGRPQDLLLVKSNRKAIIILTILIAAQNFSGYSVIIMNLHTILTEADSVYIASEYTGIIVSAIMAIAAAVCSLSVDKCGRKILLVISGISTGVCLLVLAIYFSLKYSDVHVQNVSWIPVMSVMAFALAFKLGLGFLPQVLVSELFSSKIKAIGMTVADAIFIIFGTLSIIFYHSLADSYGTDVPLYIFAAIAFASAAYTFFIVPETKGKSLEEIQLMLKS